MSPDMACREPVHRIDADPHARRESGSAYSGETKTVAIDRLDERYGELRLNRPSVMSALRRSIEREGLLRPLLVNLERDGKLAVLDGLKRLRVLHALGRREVQVIVVQLDIATALVALMAHNAPHHGLCELEQAWVVRKLVRGCKLQQLEVAELFGRHVSWVSRRLSLCEQLCEEVQQDIRLGLVSTSAARELWRLPRGNQAPVALAVRQHHLSSRQCAKLVEQALRCHDAPALDALLRDPWRRIGERQTQEPARDPRLGEAAETLRSRLIGLERSASWLHESLLRHPLASLSSEELEILGELAASVRERCEHITTRLEELLAAVSP